MQNRKSMVCMYGILCTWLSGQGQNAHRGGLIRSFERGRSCERKCRLRGAQDHDSITFGLILREGTQHDDR